MHFSAITILSLTAISAALPTKRAVQARQKGASVLATTTYDAISISGGTAGNAESEALAVFANLDTANPENISKDDQDTLNEINQVANDAEKEAFNTAIDAASGDEATALQNGKIKNKVLKLEATVLKLKAQQAQGEDVASKLADEQKKLDNNIALDVAAAGQPSTFLSFDATIDGAGAGAGAGAAAAAAGTGNAATKDAATDVKDKAKAAENADDEDADDDDADAEKEDEDDD